MRFRLTINDKHVCDGVLAVGEDGHANFFSGDGSSADSLVATMVRCRLDFAAAFVVRLSGFAPTGKFQKDGREIFAHTEWYLRYLD